MNNGNFKINLFTTEWIKSQLNPFKEDQNTDFHKYKSPELLDKDELPLFTKESDIFNLGVVLYELYMKQHPFEGGSNLKTIINIINNSPH